MRLLIVDGSDCGTSAVYVLAQIFSVQLPLHSGAYWRWRVNFDSVRENGHKWNFSFVIFTQCCSRTARVNCDVGRIASRCDLHEGVIILDPEAAAVTDGELDILHKYEYDYEYMVLILNVLWRVMRAFDRNTRGCWRMRGSAFCFRVKHITLISQNFPHIDS